MDSYQEEGKIERKKQRKTQENVIITFQVDLRHDDKVVFNCNN